MICIHERISGYFMVSSVVKARKLTGIAARATAIRVVDFMAILDSFSFFFFGIILYANSMLLSADVDSLVLSASGQASYT